MLRKKHDMLRQWMAGPFCAALYAGLLFSAGCGGRGPSGPATVDTTPPLIDTAAVAEYVIVDSVNVTDQDGMGIASLALTVRRLPEGKRLVAQWFEADGAMAMAYSVKPDEAGKAALKIAMTARNPGSKIVFALQ